MNLIDREGNETSPLFSIDDKRRHRVVVDYEESKVMFKKQPRHQAHLADHTKRITPDPTYTGSV